jgi:hypothetical protein
MEASGWFLGRLPDTCPVSLGFFLLLKPTTPLLSLSSVAGLLIYLTQRIIRIV